MNNDLHRHDDPANANVRIMLDPTVTGNPLRWAMSQLRWKLPAMLERVGYDELGRQIDLLQLASALGRIRIGRAVTGSASRKHCLLANKGPLDAKPRRRGFLIPRPDPSGPAL